VESLRYATSRPIKKIEARSKITQLSEELVLESLELVWTFHLNKFQKPIYENVAVVYVTATFAYNITIGLILYTTDPL
jgi:hypothetical protein